MFAGLGARARSLWRGVRRRSRVDADMNEEFRLHLEMRADDLVRSGLSPADAKKRARLEFGNIEEHRDAGADSRGLRRFDELRVSWLDFKLGFRMLVKYPGLTIVGGLAIAFAVGVGAGTFEFVNQILYPALPVAEGDRVVGVRDWNVSTQRVEREILHDVAVWRAEATSFEGLGAFRTVDRNLITPEGSAEPVIVAEIHASAFQVARVRPILGRTLTEADERAGGPAVALIGYDVWQARFRGDSSVIGQTARIGSVVTTIIGVMPRGFAFPIFHNAWVPLRLDPLDYEIGKGPTLAGVVARLKPGVSIDDARSELNLIGQRRSVDHPATHGQLRPQVLPFALSIRRMPMFVSLMLMGVNVFLVMLLVLVFGNVALLMFARAATRESEIVVRAALGASRGRIIMQLFAEALALGSVGAVLGLGAAQLTLRWALILLQVDAGDGRLPFWFHGSLSPTTVIYAAALTLLGATIAGVLPALKVTRGVEPRLRQMAAGGSSLRFGGVWTAVIVSQVAVTVAFPVTVFFSRRDMVQVRSFDVGFPSQEYLSAFVAMERPVPALGVDDHSRERFLTTVRELERRLLAESGVTGVTFANVLPGMNHSRRRIDVEGGAAPAADSTAGQRVASASVDVSYFRVLDASIRSGRVFNAGDVGSAARPVVVNDAFVRQVLAGRNAIGRRVRYADPGDNDAPRPAGWTPGPWYEIVGVVNDLGMSDGSDPFDSGAGIYHAASLQSAPLYVMAHTSGDPSALAPRLRQLAVAVDPDLRLEKIMPVDHVQDANLQSMGFWVQLLAVVSAIALLLSLAGIYAVMAFTVSRRTREIGVRVALGSDRRSVLIAIFARPLRQIALGILAGSVLTTALVFMIMTTLTIREVAMLASYAALMMGVCMLACIVPTRRALRVQPTEALRAEG